jgi:hypothetical protein
MDQLRLAPARCLARAFNGSMGFEAKHRLAADRLRNHMDEAEYKREMECRDEQTG